LAFTKFYLALTLLLQGRWQLQLGCRASSH